MQVEIWPYLTSKTYSSVANYSSYEGILYNNYYYIYYYNNIIIFY